MRKSHSFLLTIIPAEHQQHTLRGRVQIISTGVNHTFQNIAELELLIQSEIAHNGEQTTQITENIRDTEERSFSYHFFPDEIKH